MPTTLSWKEERGRLLPRTKKLLMAMLSVLTVLPLCASTLVDGLPRLGCLQLRERLAGCE